jgi:bifunctional DNase/RNase
MAKKKYIEISIKDILGPLPVDNSCIIVVCAGRRMFPITSSYADAQACNELMKGESQYGPNSYEMMSNLTKTLNVNVEQVELTLIDGAFFSKIHFDPKLPMGETLRIVNPNPMSSINFGLAHKTPILIEGNLKVPDITATYTSLKEEVGELWPLPKITKTESLRVLSEFIDSVQA